jgi:hypothetical protein
MVIRTYNNLRAARTKDGHCVVDGDTGEVLITDLWAPEIAENAVLLLRGYIDEGESIGDAVALTLDALNLGPELVDPPMADEMHEMERLILASESDGLCLCGCGERPRKKGSRFMPGHDGRLKGDLIWLARSGDKTALIRLDKLGWGNFITRAERDELEASRKGQ